MLNICVVGLESGVRGEGGHEVAIF